MSVWKDGRIKGKYQQCQCGHLGLYHNERTGECQAYNMRKAVIKKVNFEEHSYQWEEEKCNCKPPITLDDYGLHV